MVQRTKRSLHPGEAAAMQKELRTFHHHVRVWLGDTPIKGSVYVALLNLNDAIILTDMQLNEAQYEELRAGGRAPP